ncbi:MAG: SCO6745 family protein [Pseudonocardiaceae bacterium]
MVHDVGTSWMISPATAARGTELGYRDRMPFYFAGRGGVLGNVHADVVSAAMGWWEPGLVRANWEEGMAVADARGAARQYGRACAAWGEEHFANIDTDRFVELAERVVATAEGSGVPLFAGWRAEPLVEAGPGRALQLIHLLREWRGGVHLAATTAVGLSPLDAILSNEGPRQAKLFGWGREFKGDYSHLRPHHLRAEEMTNQVTLAGYERAFPPAERDEFADLVTGIGEAVLGQPQAGPGNARTARDMKQPGTSATQPGQRLRP